MRERFLLSVALAFSLAAFPSIVHAKPMLGADPESDRTDANIAVVESEMLQTYHYSQQPYDEEMSGKQVDRYLEALDYWHLIFLQSDIAEYASYRTNLQVLTLKKHDISPCYIIFDTFMERARERVSYVTNLLQTEKFEFTGHDRYISDRHKLPYPADLDEAKKLWKEELRFEYLKEKLDASDVKFSGPVHLEGKKKAIITLARDKSHPLKFDFLPRKFYAKDGDASGFVDVTENGSNATIHVIAQKGANFNKYSTKIYSDKGTELGTITLHLQTNKTDINGVIQLNQKNMAEIYKTLTNRYVRFVKNYEELDRDDVFEMYLNSLAHAYDPHSDYMGRSAAENFQISMKLSLVGIGAVLTSDDGYCKITELKEGPAMKSGKIKPGDRIIAVAQHDQEPVEVVGMKLQRIVDMIRGTKGTEVTLTLIPVDAPDSTVHETVSLVRDVIKLDDAAAKAKIFETPAKHGPAMRLGYIDLPSFYGDMDSRKPDDESERKSTTTDVAKLITRLKKENVGGIILDLRRNGGGYLEEAIRLTGLFVPPKGPVVQTKDPNGEIVTDRDPDRPVLYDGPLILLTSRFSASASEILAGALQDYGRALIVGEKSSFGKGTVQTMQPLGPYLNQRHLTFTGDPGQSKITIKKFYRAGGSSTQLKGVIPEIVLPSVWNYADVGESSLPNAMPWDEVPSADPADLNRVKPYLADLQKHLAKQMATNMDITYLNEDIEEYKKSLVDKSVSLNEAERLAEQKDRKAREEARKTERLARAKSSEKVFEITFKNIDLPELQPPAVKTNNLAAASKAAAVDSSEDNEDMADGPDGKEDPGPGDEMLEETKHILADYILLQHKSPVAVSN